MDDLLALLWSATDHERMCADRVFLVRRRATLRQLQSILMYQPCDTVLCTVNLLPSHGGQRGHLPGRLQCVALTPFCQLGVDLQTFNVLEICFQLRIDYRQPLEWEVEAMRDIRSAGLRHRQHDRDRARDGD